MHQQSREEDCKRVNTNVNSAGFKILYLDLKVTQHIFWLVTPTKLNRVHTILDEFGNYGSVALVHFEFATSLIQVVA